MSLTILGFQPSVGEWRPSSFPHLFLFSMSYFPLSGSLCILLPSFPNPSGLVMRPSEKVLSGSSPFRSCWYSFVETNGKSKGRGILK